MCCVYITVLARLGVVSAGLRVLVGRPTRTTATVLVRLAGLTVVVVLAWVALRSAKCPAWLVGTARRG